MNIVYGCTVTRLINKLSVDVIAIIRDWQYETMLEYCSIMIMTDQVLC